MAFTVDLTENEGVALPWDGLNKHFVIKKTVDFGVAANNLAHDCHMALMPIPGGVLVEEVILLITENADSDCDALDVGSFEEDGTAIVADGFIDGATIYTTTGTVAAPVYVRDVAGETYSITDGTVGFVRATDWVLGCENDDDHTIDNGIITFIAICKDLR